MSKQVAGMVHEETRLAFPRALIALKMTIAGDVTESESISLYFCKHSGDRDLKASFVDGIAVLH
jgi:hypothetical protein